MKEIAKYQSLALESGCGELVELTRIKRNNNVDRLVTSDGVFFCKTYTNSWYGPVETNWYPVHHESEAYETLRRNGLNTPEVIRAELSADNPLARLRQSKNFKH